MTGRTKLGTIRKEVRKAFKMSDAKLLEWFNGQIQDLAHKPRANQAEMETLRLLRDALVKEKKRGRTRLKRPRLPSAAKN